MEQENLDLHLIKALQSGDDHAFRHVYETHYDSLCIWALTLTGDKAAAEDAVSHGLTQLYKHRKEMSSMISIKAFLITVIKNKCLDELRRQKQENLRRNEQPSRPNVTEGTENKLMLADLTDLIMTFIKQFPERQQEAFKKYILDGYTAKEVSKELDISETTAREDANRVLSKVVPFLLKNGVSMLVIGWWLSHFA